MALVESLLTAIVRADGPAMPAFMVQILALSLLAFTLLYLYLLLRRVQVERLRQRLALLPPKPASPWA